MGSATVGDSFDNFASSSKSALSSASLQFLLLGDVGVGKSTFVDTFISTLANVQSVEHTHETTIAAILSDSLSSSSSIQLNVTKVKTGAIFNRTTNNDNNNNNSNISNDDNNGASRSNRLRNILPPTTVKPARDISFITIPGYSSTMNPSQTLSITDNYLNHHLRTVTSVFSPTISSAQLAWFLISGSQAHTLPTCAFYFVLYELKPIDIIYMKLIHERVNLVPMIAKSDTVSRNELWVLKRRLVRQLKMNNIQFHTFGLGLDTVESMAEQHQWEAPPFVISSKVDPQTLELCESELEAFVQMCVYDRVRFVQLDAARKAITWRVYTVMGKNGTSNRTPPALEPRPRFSSIITTTTTATTTEEAAGNGGNDISMSMTSPFMPPLSAAQSSSSITRSVSGMISPPPSMLTVTMTQKQQEESTTIGPHPGLPAATTTSSSSTTTIPRNVASDARVMVIHHETGMIVDASNRPNEIMDTADTINTVHARSTMEGDHFAGDSMFKVEVPNSSMSYHPGSIEIVDNSATNGGVMTEQQQQQLYLYQAGEGGGGYLVPPGIGDLFKAVNVKNVTAITGSNGGGMVLGSESQLQQGQGLDIWEAAELGDVATVQFHLNSGVSPDQRNSSKSTLLHRTAWQGSHPYPVMRLLISYGANVNLANENGNTVLQNVLMKHDEPQLIKLLLDNGAEAVILNKEGMNTLEVASLFNRVESAKFLLENDLSSSEQESIAHALQRAKGPDKKAMKSLLKSWQGKEGEKKRLDLMQRLQQQEQKQQKQQQQQHQVSSGGGGAHSNEGSSIKSFDTTKNGSHTNYTASTTINNNKAASSSRASSVHQSHETDFGGSTTNVSQVSSTNSAGHHQTTTTQPSSVAVSTISPASVVPTSTQQKHMSHRFNLKAMRTAAPSMSNLFSRKN
ncbi:hypothetical protein BG004_005070 [Podila humilis]|nr:hypothetical protein BG004_005070 [Podila humilis]